jgi:hypothetical protein
MARSKEWWTGHLFSYGPVFTDGMITGFHMSIKADDHTESGRIVDIPMDADTLRHMASYFEEAEDRHGT